MKIKLWKCGNCGHLEPVTNGDIPELNPAVSSTGAIKVTCPNCGAYTISKTFDNTFKGGSFLVVKPHIKRYKIRKRLKMNRKRISQQLLKSWKVT